MTEGAPVPTQDEQEALKVVIVDQSHDAIDEARDRADARLSKELGEGGRFRRFISGIWKGNMAKEYYRQKYIQQGIEAIQTSNDVLADSPADRRTRALEATIARFQGEHEELIHNEAGESREVQQEDDGLAVGVKQLVRDFVEGRLNVVTLQEERTRLLTNYRAAHGEEAAGKGLVTTDNLLQIAQTVAGVVEHGESLDSAINRMQVITGEARNGVRTEVQYNRVDAAIDKLSKHKITALVTPGTLAVGVAAAASIARMGSHSVVGAVTKTIVPGAAAGLWAGLRENKRVKDERTQHAREMATGGHFQEGDKRRVEMETTRYESIAAIDLISHLQSVGDAERVRDGGEEALQAALDALAAVQARVQLSDTKGIDLISYTGKTEVGEERLMLDLARSEARRTLESTMSDEVRTALGLSDERTLKHVIQERAGLVSEVLTGEITAKDVAFNKLKRRRVARAAAVGVATGVIGGLMVQEAVAAVDPTRFGLIDMARGAAPVPLGNGSVHQTILEGAFRGDETTIHTGASSSYDTYTTSPRGSIEVSNDHMLITNEDGTIDLKDPNGHFSVEGLHVDENGTLDQASLDKLNAAGMVVEDKSFDQDITTSATQTLSTEQFLQNHADASTKVTRDFWYGNDTPNVYDQNELRLYRGGSADAPGLVDGGYQYSIAGMHADGSWQGGESVDWNQAAENGNMFVAISGTVDSQGNPFMIPIGPDGTINIPADSPAGQFFANENNSVGFNGAYMEVVQTSGVDADGTVHIRPLATLVGDRSVHEINDTITTVTTEHHAEYAITSNGFDTVQDNFTEMAPITPVASRRSMEAIRDTPESESTVETPPIRAYGYGERFPSSREEFSPSLRNNPEAQLDLRQELGWFRSELARRDGPEYAAEIQKIVSTTPELAAGDTALRSIFTMPVAAAYESENIYGTLSLYSQQDEEQLARNLIILNTNWLESAQQDPEKNQKIQKTLAEIERAKRDFPNLRIATFTRQYDDTEVGKTGGVIGYVAADLMNVALLTLEQQASANPSLDMQDVAIIRQDADMEGISRHYLRNLEKSVESSEADIFNGSIRSGVRMQTRYPGIGIVTNFSQALNITRTQQNQPWTVGINTVVRASTLAAVGGLGRRGRWTGPGSDDVQVGQRIQAARRREGSAETIGDGYYGVSSPTGRVNGRKIVTQVAGLTVDSSALRLIPQYLVGRHFGAAWDGNTSGDSGFSAGPGGYKNREEFASEIMSQNPREIIDDDHMFKFININMTAELVNNGVSGPDATPEDKEAARAALSKALAVFFGSVPGAYIIHGELGEKNVRFELTEAGKRFIKLRAIRETNGRFGSYGFRKMRQLYGVSGARKPVAAQSPLVSPLV